MDEIQAIWTKYRPSDFLLKRYVAIHNSDLRSFHPSQFQEVQVHPRMHMSLYRAISALQ